MLIVRDVLIQYLIRVRELLILFGSRCIDIRQLSIILLKIFKKEGVIKLVFEFVFMNV